MKHAHPVRARLVRQYLVIIAVVIALAAATLVLLFAIGDVPMFYIV